MIKSKKFMLLGLTILFSQTSIAQVVALDALNPDNCRQQLMSVEDDYPVVVVYRSDLPEQDQMMATYEKLSEEYAQEHPTRTFFKFDMADYYNWQAYTACTQQQGYIGTPSAMIFAKFHDPLTRSIYMWGPIRMDSGADMTREDLIKIAEISRTKKAAIAKAFAAEKPHKK